MVVNDGKGKENKCLSPEYKVAIQFSFIVSIIALLYLINIFVKQVFP